MSRNTPLEALAEPLREIRERFEAEVEPHRNALWHYCLRLTGSPWDAEDLVQDTLQRALGRLAQLWQPVSAPAYLFRTATNLWIDRHRREARAELQQLTPEIGAEDAAPDLRIAAHEALAHVVAVLTPLQRVVFLLTQTLDFKAREVAQMLGMSEGAVKAALHRARRAVAGRSQGEGAEPIVLLQPDEVDETVRRFIDAFDRRDPDAIARLLHEDAVTTIVGSAEELGRETSRSASLAEWAEEPTEQWVRPVLVAGREVLVVCTRGDGDAECLYSLIDLQVAARTILQQRVYFYSPELLEYVADALGMPAVTHGYRYTAPVTARSERT